MKEVTHTRIRRRRPVNGRVISPELIHIIQILRVLYMDIVPLR